MSTKHHTQSHNTGDVTSCIVLICSFLIIGIFIIAMLTLHFSTKRDQQLLDLEACQYLLGEDNSGFYGTSRSSLHTWDNLEARRTLRHDQVCNDNSGVYRISVQRLEEAEVSSSSDESESHIASTHKTDILDGESGEESSESESESSDDSSSESPEGTELSRLMSTKKPLLPKRVAALKGMQSGWLPRE
ncbi:hypothetical protein B5807_01146 [Epicoccum nigrum]|uniref:Uncharacterized protein n=1 Tax=Epicoccum nigrum TaxID=105696 RepID=A0A1Y2MFP5_EPING|nr:hypothetical protein B5807_01146 [Epicoccum nigrum]